MICKDCDFYRQGSIFCGKAIPQEQIDCPEYRPRRMVKQTVTTRNPYINMSDLYPIDKGTKDTIDAMRYGWEAVPVRKEYNKMFKMDKVKKVIFNPPATIVYWFDGTKTIVKTQNGEIFDKEKGFAMACAKKFFGNEGNYYNEFRKHGADNHCYSVHIDLASFENRTGESIAKDVKSAIKDDKSPNEIRELVGLPPVRDIHEAAMPSAIREELEKSELDRNRNIKIKDVFDRLKRFVDDRKLGIYTSKNSTGYLMKFEGMINGKKQAYNHHISNVELDTYMAHRIASNTEYLVNAWYATLEIEGSKLAEAIEERE